MPIPKPHSGENENDFIGRCMSDDVMQEDYPDEDQRLAICYESWRDKDKKRFVRSVKRSTSAVSHARSLIAAGKVDRDSLWDFSSDDRHALLESVDNDWSEYGKWFLGHDDDFKEDTFERYKYPYGKGGKVYRRAVIAIKSRAAQQGENEIADAAGGLLDLIDKEEESSVYGSYPVEVRSIKRPIKVERRTVDDRNLVAVTGYAAIFNSVSDDIFFWREVIDPGAFTKTIKEGDVRALINHDPNLVLGRTTNGTLKLWEDDVGLGFSFVPPETTYAADLLVSMERGDISGSSIGFICVKEFWEGEGDSMIRRLKELRLFDISVVTFPAYSQTKAQIGALAKAGIDERTLEVVVGKHSRGYELSGYERRFIKDAIDVLDGYLHGEPSDGHSPEAEPDYNTLLRMRRILIRIKKRIGG